MSVGQIAQGAVPGVARRVAKRDATFVLALVVFGLIAVIALIGPWIAPYPADELYVGPINGAPSLAHPFGTDDVGRDILSRVLVGAQVSVFAPIVVVALSTMLGLTLAVTAAWFGGWVSGTL
ncbi:MAG: ABC transporter permease, partial [Microbacterium sp.]